jgi:hypothetical protein
MGRTSRMNEKRIACSFLLGNREENNSLGRARCKREYNIKMDLGEITWVGMDWNNLTQDGNRCRALANTAVYFKFHKMLEDF